MNRVVWAGTNLLGGSRIFMQMLNPGSIEAEMQTDREKRVRAEVEWPFYVPAMVIVQYYGLSFFSFGL